MCSDLPSNSLNSSSSSPSPLTFLSLKSAEQTLNLEPSTPFRLGTTSYIIPDDILPNVRYLADKVQDVELVLFEVDDGPNNLPSSETVAELAALADAHDLTYTVHLPLDLRLGADGDEGHISLV